MNKSEKYYIKQYQQKGYVTDYQMINENLIDLKSKKEYKPEDIFIVAEHRFEGMSNPSDMSILYVIEAKNNSRGTVLVPYGAATTSLAEFFAMIPKENCSNKVNIDNQ